MSPQNFYVYTLTNSLTGHVFYVGKGHDPRRMFFHEWEAKCGVESYKCKKIRKIWHQGGEIIKEKVAEFAQEQDAHIYEWILINLVYGRKGLTNLTDGGEGITGYKGNTHPPSQIEKHRQALKQIFSSPQRIDQQRQHQLQRWMNNPQERERYRKMFEDPSIRAQAGAANIGNIYHAKTYVGFVSPFGVVYKDIHNLKAFCQKHNLSAPKMCLVNNGKNHSHQGWTRYNPQSH